MANVAVYDAAYVEALEASVVVGGQVNEAGQLVLIRGNGEQFNAGQVVGGLDTYYPVGCVYTSFEPTSPQDLFGGTWTRLKDRMLIGVGDNGRWDTVGEVGGSETVTLTIAQMPEHGHSDSTGTDWPDHGHSGSTTTAGGHEHGEGESGATAFQPTGETGVVRQIMTNPTEGTTTGGGGHGHDVAVGGASARHSHAIPHDGGGQPHDNMPPFQAVFMWRRTA